MRRVRSRALRAASRALRGRDRLLDDLLRVGRVLLEELGQPLVDRLLDETLHAGVPELGLRLPLELGLAELHGDDRGEALADVLALEVLLLLLQEALVARVAVQGAGERRLEAGQVRAALVRVDVVREREDRVHIGGVPLHRDLDGALVALALEVDDVLVHRILGVVHEGDEVADPALVVELVRLLAFALVHEHDAETAGEEGRLAKTLHERLDREIELLEDVGVGQEADRRPGVAALGLADLGEVAGGDAAGELLPVDLAVAPNLGDEPLGERVHDRDADAVEAAGDLVAVAAELSAGVQLRQDDRESGEPLVGHDGHGDARAPVPDDDGIVRTEGHLDALVTPCESLVDRVVDHLVDEVMEPAGARRADVHAGSLANGVEALENGDVFGVVCGLGHKKIPALGGFLS